MVTSDTALQPIVAAEYLALADVLEAATEDEWNAPSLCEGWRVRDVIIHLTMPARYDPEAPRPELEAHDVPLGLLTREISARDAQLPTDGLVGNLRSEVMLYWESPRSGYRGALNHVVIHGLDVTVPLKVERHPPKETMRVVLDNLTEGRIHEHFSTVIAGRRLEATDLNWSCGVGALLRGTAEDLALALCGRTIPSGRLHGDPL
jgi:uncharacterized protein (TIGR03083 family)